MAVVNKKNGSLRICIDPQCLDTALKREHFKLPTLDDISPELHDAKVFSKLDVKQAYWHVELDDESSKLTTMITRFGRYCWKRLPFGLKVSSEIFQRKLHDVLFDLPGGFAVADDVIVVGLGVTTKDALTDHDMNLHKLYERCREQHIMLNDDKAEMRTTEITFMGHRITKKVYKLTLLKLLLYVLCLHHLMYMASKDFVAWYNILLVSCLILPKC